MQTTAPRSNAFFGYYDAPGQTTPAYDPRDTVPCLFCMKAMEFSTGTLRTISLMRLAGDLTVRETERGNEIVAAPHDDRSYFYRVHKVCDDEITDEEQSLYEGAVIDLPPSS